VLKLDEYTKDLTEAHELYLKDVEVSNNLSDTAITIGFVEIFRINRNQSSNWMKKMKRKISYCKKSCLGPHEITQLRKCKKVCMISLLIVNVCIEGVPSQEPGLKGEQAKSNIIDLKPQFQQNQDDEDYEN
jgi:hypothetical protein